MLSQPQDRTQIGAQAPPLNDAAEARHPLKKWLALGIALIAVAALLVSGIWSRVGARKTLNARLGRTMVSNASHRTTKRATNPGTTAKLLICFISFLSSFQIVHSKRLFHSSIKVESGTRVGAHQRPP